MFVSEAKPVSWSSFRVVCVALLVQVVLAAGMVRAIEPADPDLIPEGRRLLEYMHEIRGKGILAGGPANVEGGPRRALHPTGRKPAIRLLTGQFFLTPGLAEPTLNAALCWGRQQGGIVHIMVHWGWPKPDGGRSFMKGHFDPPLALQTMLTPGTEEYKQFRDDLSVYADYLGKLADAGVAVIWAPFHEIDGGWFWWTDAETPENTAVLWRQMFDYLVKERGVHNLIWIFQPAHVAHASRGRIRREHGRNPTIEEEAEYRSRFYPGDEYVDIAGISTYGTRGFYDWGWGSAWEDTRPSAYKLLQLIAPGPGRNGMLAVSESYGLINPVIARRDETAWVYCLTWGMTDLEWDRWTFNHDHFITLDELPVLREGNVTPNVRITHPAEGIEARGRRLHILGVANDRNGNLENVSVHALQGSWVNWWDIPRAHPVEYADGYQPMRDAFGEDTYLGRAEVEPSGRWSFTWENPPAGFHNIVAFARDEEGAVGASNVIRITAGLEDLARGKEATATIHQAPHAPEGAVDGELMTGWWAGVPKNHRGEPVVAGPQWLQVDLGEERRIGAASVLWWRARATHYTVQVSGDGEEWRTVAAVEGIPLNSDGSGYPVDRDGYELHQDIHRFQPVEARYVRLHCTQHAVRWQTYCVFDFAVYEELPEGAEEGS